MTRCHAVGLKHACINAHTERAGHDLFYLSADAVGNISNSNTYTHTYTQHSEFAMISSNKVEMPRGTHHVFSAQDDEHYEMYLVPGWYVY